MLCPYKGEFGGNGGSGHGNAVPLRERRDGWNLESCGGRTAGAHAEERARILGSGRRICIVLEMRHLLGSRVEKAARLLLE
jgi:hypothetical protein